MSACITIVGSDIYCSRDTAGSKDFRIALSNKTLASLNKWSGRYNRGVRSGDPAPLLALGIEMFTWLDENGWASEWTRGAGERILEVAVDDPGSEAASVLLDLPWEILVHKGDFLAADPNQAYIVYRRIGPRVDAAPTTPAYRDLAVMFMAASPEGQRELDFEAEEAAILAATARLPIQLFVEESGCRDFLKERLALDGPFEAVHLSCHGDIRPDIGPVLALETPEGGIAPATPGDIASALGENKAPLVFLSACRTAASNQNSVGEQKPEVIEPLVRALVRAGVPNVVGWDGSVYDLDATLFARTFYKELAGFASVPYAAAIARRDVLREHRNDPQKGRHWHLARAYAGCQGGGPLCDRAKPKRRFRKGAGYREFLDKAENRVPVATAQEFVGRRRQAQAVLRVFRDDEKAGVLIYGMGSIGKSSLAARVANRMPKNKTVVIYNRYDGLAIFDRLLAALPGSERLKWDQQWREVIADNGAMFNNALEEMLTGPFDDQPILLIIDDLEQILESPSQGQHTTPVKDAPGTADTWRLSLGGILRTFEAADTESKLLLTSRYLFSLFDGQGRDLADALEQVQLRPMADKERAKQWQAAERSAERAQEATSDERLFRFTRRIRSLDFSPYLNKPQERRLNMRKIICVLYVIAGLMASTAPFAQNVCTCTGLGKDEGCGQGHAEEAFGGIHDNIEDSKLGTYLDLASLTIFQSTKLAWSAKSGWLCTRTDKPIGGWFDVITYNIHGTCGHGGLCAKEKEELGRVLQKDLVNDRTILALQEDWRYNGYTSGVVHDLRHPGYDKFPKGETCNDPEHTHMHIELPFQSVPHKSKLPYQSVPQDTDWCSPTWNDGLNLFSAFPFINPVSEGEHTVTRDSRGVAFIDLYREAYNTKSTLFSILWIKIPVGAEKGFSLARVAIAPRVTIDVYNTHAGDYRARAPQFAQFTKRIKEISFDKDEPNLVIVVGDTNLVWVEEFREKYPNSGPQDAITVKTFLKENWLKSACKAMGICPSAIHEWPFPAGIVLDQIMFRGNSFFSLEAVGYQQLDLPFSDHQPIRVRFAWRQLKPLPPFPPGLPTPPFPPIEDHEKEQ